MKRFHLAQAVVLAMLPASAYAQDAAPTASVTLMSNALLKSSDGRMIGRIDHIDKSKDGLPIAAEIITDGGFVSVPAGTISSADKGRFVTSLTYKQVIAGK